MVSSLDGISESDSSYLYLLDPVTDSFPVYFVKQKTRKFSTHRNKCRYPKRLVLKNGSPRLYKIKRALLAIIYIHDLANTLINSSWKWTLIAISSAYMFTWLVFALFWTMISQNSEEVDVNNTNGSACLYGIQGFAGYLLFSIETQTSIGYGNRYISHHCPEAVVLFCIQILTGVAVCGLFIGIVYEKLTSPEKTSAENCFSRHAVICQRDGRFCLIFRLRDVRQKFQFNNSVKAYVVQKRDGEPFLKTIKLESFGILIWPNELVHLINSDSPFWDLSAKDLILSRFEIVVTMEGTCLSTSKMSNATASYLNTEIKWGHTFKSCVFFDREKECYRVDHRRFNSTEAVTMPLCSARRLREVCEDLTSLKYCPTYSNSSATGTFSNSSLDEVVTSTVTVHANELSNKFNHTQHDEKTLSLLLRLQTFLQENDSANCDHEYIETSL